MLVLTETYSVGGCDRFLADLAAHTDPADAKLLFAGNPHPDLDEYLAARIPGFAGRDLVDLSSMREPLLGRVAMRTGLSRRAREEPGAGAPQADPPPRSALGAIEDAVSAAQLSAQRARNLRLLRELVKRHRPDVLHANNGGYAGAESVRIAPVAAAREGVPSVQFVHNMPYPLSFPGPSSAAWTGASTARCTAGSLRRAAPATPWPASAASPGPASRPCTTACRSRRRRRADRQPATRWAFPTGRPACWSWPRSNRARATGS